MRILIYIGLVASFCLCGFSVQAVTGTVSSHAKLRVAALEGASITRLVIKGSSVDVLEEVGDWVKIRTSSGGVGWIPSRSIIFSSVLQKNVESVPIFSLSESSGVFLYNSRIREGGSLDHRIIRIVGKGKKVTILQEKSGWYEVSSEGLRGWAASWLLQKEDGVDVPSQVLGVKIGDIPSTAPTGINEDALNRYWLNQINILRKQRGLRLLFLDDRWRVTAHEYAQIMTQYGYRAHQRPDGKSMHKWIDTKGLDFTVRNSSGGWVGNYFTENLTWGRVSQSTDSVKRKLDSTLAFFLGEASYNGAHYRTIYHEDWNSVGLGFDYVDKGNGMYDISVVMHYGSLQL
ncbi:MAG: SH3 domain-containing protein [Candidatus Magasanikbacteria bacterium]|jgi:uncharacterized protein YkwD/SH3-like domain-containing protein|nr:SH3 domain-containing protein [Candidatus Magasanikbacteria bacterium]MBT4220998.1 SH3 domain-containing protein [Candidatus Magasanikbacteria bacterium]MBT4350516.1 SH3 domain-containing protein [Candidatus Magasanikbacteria bacterium]MBT4541931.1 SH3 domain-containing protein [Candidatus Magasanikbacteria bacterium]MBT6253062.1 SH3 domain-containing protein [Candidatus Magasanikbacteria bacterium]